MCPDTKALLAYVKSELFFAAICYYIKINPKPITAMAKKIAEQLIDTLVKSGVERIYAVTGDSLNEVNEAVRKNDQIKWIHVRHEETGAYAAAAEAQLTGRPRDAAREVAGRDTFILSTVCMTRTVPGHR